MSIEYPCVHWNEGKCKKFSNDKVTSWCVESPCEDQTPSNADRIRVMTDEELSKFLCANTECGSCKWNKTEGCTLTEWLKQTAMVEAAEDYLQPLPFKNAFDDAIAKAKSEAIKKFVEKLKDRNRGKVSVCVGWVDFDDIDNLVKEMEKDK